MENNHILPKEGGMYKKKMKEGVFIRSLRGLIFFLCGVCCLLF